MFQKQCKKAKSELWVSFKPSLFQHIGTHSSLKGKVQKLKVGGILLTGETAPCGCFSFSRDWNLKRFERRRAVWIFFFYFRISSLEKSRCFIHTKILQLRLSLRLSRINTIRCRELTTARLSSGAYCPYPGICLLSHSILLCISEGLQFQFNTAGVNGFFFFLVSYSVVVMLNIRVISC